MYWNYRVLSLTGQEITGELQGARREVMAIFHERQWELIALSPDYGKALSSFGRSKAISSQILAEFFADFHNMFLTGMGINQIIASLSETTASIALRQLLIDVEVSLKRGESLAQAMQANQSLPWIVCSTIYAGERSGRLKETMDVLAQYFKRSAEIKSKMLNASVYPIIVFVLLLGVMFFISVNVIPKLQNLLPPQALQNTATRGVLFLSWFMRKTALFWISFAFAAGTGFYHIYKEHRQELEMWLYQLPLLGAVLKESALALYFLNLSVLLKSGVPLMKAIWELEGAMANGISRKFLDCRDFMLGGLSFWEAIKQEEFFPSVTSFTLRRGEETAKLEEYCANLSDYFNKRVQGRVDQLINLIQPALLGIAGLFLIVIAFAFLVPIYGSLTKIANG